MKRIFQKLFSKLWFLGLVTLILFPLAAWPILHFQDKSFWNLFRIEGNDWYTLPAYTAYGIMFALIIIWFTEHPFFERSMNRYKNILSQFKLNYAYAFFLAICAGVGEEVFFRGAIQPLIGILLTAIIFVAIHGYFSFKVWKVNLFAVGLIAFITLIGYGAEKHTLWHAILPHFSYDFVLLVYAIKKQ